MNHLDLTLPTPAENLACDEALLDRCDAGDGPEVLRFWEPLTHFVVVGYSNRVGREVNVKACQKNDIPILRRCSGGGTVLQGPGCLNYSLILRIDSNPALQRVTGTNRFVMERNRAALETLLSGGSRRNEAQSSESSIQHPASSIEHPESRIAVRGHTDLAIDGRKFSGNAQRRKRHAVLFHGTFLLNIHLPIVSELLSMPSKQPDYREGRSHAEFLMNLAAPAEEVKAALRRDWQTDQLLADPPIEATRALVAQKYATQEWNLRIVSR